MGEGCNEQTGDVRGRATLSRCRPGRQAGTHGQAVLGSTLSPDVDMVPSEPSNSPFRKAANQSRTHTWMGLEELGEVVSFPLDIPQLRLVAREGAARILLPTKQLGEHGY